jgi:AcrR family transcriptional regulator
MTNEPPTRVTMKDAEATRERILEAAMAEFAAYGIAGARVDRIARASAANKNSIYRYFDSKEQLFTAVLQRHLERVYTEVPFTPEDLPGFAVRFFDFAMSHPDLMRLMAWSGLERSAATPPALTESMHGKLAALAAAQMRGTSERALPPAFLFTVITAIASAWSAVNPVWMSIDPEALTDLPALRAGLASAVERLCAD